MSSTIKILLASVSTILAAGIVSAARGSKPREVLIKTEADLREVLRRAI